MSPNPPQLLLRANAISKRFGGVQAVKDVSLDITQGEIFGLIGPNGAGKTTFFNILTGFVRADSGSFHFFGAPLPNAKPHLIAQMGIARTFQNIRLFANRTVLENIMIGCHARAHAGVWGSIIRNAATRKEEAFIRACAEELIVRVGISAPAESLAGTLAYSEQRRLEIARALAADPKLLVLDEPAAGMHTGEREQLEQLIRSLGAAGITVLLIEHDVKLVMRLCTRIAVLDYGVKIADDVPEIVQQDPKVIAAYLGTEAT